MERAPEQNSVLKTCEELGIGFVPWGPVGLGYLTENRYCTNFDASTDLRAGFRFTPENLAANMPIVDLLRRFAEKRTLLRLKFLLLGLWHRSHGLFRSCAHVI